MAFDFPASPVLDQTYTAHGVTFRWNSYAWVQVGSAYAPLASPVFTGDPQAPTPLTADNDTSIATTAFVKAQGYLLSADLTPYALLASPTFTGDPKAPTPATADNDTSIATTAFVKAQAYAPLASPVFTGDPTAPTPATADNDTSIATTAFVKAQAYAPLASPALTGNPTSVTPTVDDNDTSIATTAFVIGQAGGANPIINGTAAPGTSLRWSRQDHVHPTDTSRQAADGDLTALAALSGINTIYYRSAADTWSPVTISTGLSFSGGALTCTVSTSGLAPLASPVFTGDPTAPTPATADNDTSIATTAFVKAQNYITASALSPYAPLASPALTGNPTAPTATAGDNDTSIATTAFVRGELNAMKAIAYVADTAPAGAADGALWYENDSGLLFIRYNDGSTTQWVAIAARAEASP